LIKATRDWGGDKSQGVAFGILEGGRGLVAAIAASIAVPADKRGSDVEFNPLQGMGVVLRRPVVWAQAAIIVCAYCCYKGLDNYSLYAVQVMGMDEVEGARLATWGVWTRPAAAVLAGLIADRFNATRAIGVTFAALCVSYGTWSLLEPTGLGVEIIYLNFFATFVGAFALRGIYFALLEENRTPKFLTGAAVGLMSLVGYTPEIFFGPISGRILDADPGLLGHQNNFIFLAIIAGVGVVAVLWLVRL